MQSRVARAAKGAAAQRMYISYMYFALLFFSDVQERVERQNVQASEECKRALCKRAVCFRAVCFPFLFRLFSAPYFLRRFKICRAAYTAKGAAERRMADVERRGCKE